MTVLSKAAAVLQPKSRCNFAARLFPLISCQIPLFGSTANFASDSNEINYFEASGWACDRPEWAFFPAFSRGAGNPVVVFGPSPRQVLVTFTMGGRARWPLNRC
jgi:hypothetical protein